MCRETNIDFNSYYFFENGTIYSKYWNKQLTGCYDKDGYTFIKLKLKNKKYDQFRLHRVIWFFFNGEIPDGLEIDHIIPIKNGGSNSLSNLRLVTPKENSNNPLTKANISNALKGKSFQKPKNNPKISKQICQYTLENDLIKVWPSAAEAARNGYNASAIRHCCNGIAKTHKNYVWRDYS